LVSAVHTALRAQRRRCGDAPPPAAPRRPRRRRRHLGSAVGACVRALCCVSL